MSLSTPVASSQPTGPVFSPDGTVAFRFWAPDQQRVDLVLTDSGKALPMERAESGLFTLTTDQATPGTRYHFQLENGLQVPDPASRFQPEDVSGPSELIDEKAYAWQDANWQGLPWEQTVLYELHVGTFTPQGTFKAVIDQLDALKALGVTAIELMPVSDFSGSRNWGYDGVLPYAPDSRYGRPEDLMALVDAAHQRGLSVWLDVVYNHFGPEGNYLQTYASKFFTEKHHTPWGAAINYDDTDSPWVRRFMIDNALHWLETYHFDGLRLDAVHTILDDSHPSFLEELAMTVRQRFDGKRHVHLVLENDDNNAHLLQRDENGKPVFYTAQWNDDSHHLFHRLLTDEVDGYYCDYDQNAAEQLGRCLTQGFAYQGEPSGHRDGVHRGQPSAHLPPTAFVNFLQNHDQVGNRALGDRLAELASKQAVHAAVSCYLLSPAIPMLWMGEEWGCRQPFPFFCDFHGELAEAVTKGRRAEFARFEQFKNAEAQLLIPDPNVPSTFESAILDRTAALQDQEARDWLTYYQGLLAIRHEIIVPMLASSAGQAVPASYEVLGPKALRVQWLFPQGKQLTLLLNLDDDHPVACPRPTGHLVASTDDATHGLLSQGILPTLSSSWFLETLSA